MGSHGAISNEEGLWILLVAVWKMDWRGQDETRSVRYKKT